MVVLNDWGLTLEIIGFIIFLFVPLQETFNLKVGGNRTSDYFDEHPKLSTGLRITGISFIVSGLAMQYAFLNP